MKTAIQQALGAFFGTSFSGDSRHSVALRGTQVAGNADEFGFELRKLRVEALGRNAKDTFGIEGAGAHLNLNFTSEAFQKIRAKFLEKT